jgi:hypothetical protein
LINDKGDVLDCPSEMVKEFNSYFSSVFTSENTSFIPESMQMFHGPEEVSLSDLDITKKMIRDKLTKIRLDKASGDDGISSRVINELQVELVEPLFIIFRKSLQSGEIPLDWRTANVSPIHKKGGRGSVGNYRPVSLTSLISKIMESLLKNSIIEFLEKINLIHNSSYGFRNGRSFLSNLFTFLDKVIKDIEDRNCVDIKAFKAFDKVPHLRLLNK